MTSPRLDPVIIGIGELCEQLPENLESASSLVDLLVLATQAACADTGASKEVIAQIDTIAMVRTFADSTPLYANTVGKVSNYPRSVAKKVGANPKNAVYSVAGGNTPQNLVTEFADKIAAGDTDMVLLMGGETLATIKAAQRAQVTLDWAEDVGGQLDDRGQGMKGMMDRQQIDNGFLSAPLMYGVLENARRHQLSMSRESYADKMAELFARFSEVSAGHESAMFPKAYTPAELLTIDAKNPMIAEPYPKSLVAKDGVNQVAAVIMTSRGRAEQLGIAAEKMVFPLTSASVTEHPLVERPSLARSGAMDLAYRAVLEKAGISASDVSAMDLYSCFPIAVLGACDALGVDASDLDHATLTGGLPFFGGPGNSYALHSVVNMVRKLRSQNQGFGLVGANGGILSKHSVGVYSRQPVAGGWQPCDDAALQGQIDKLELPEVDHNPNGLATIESYSVTYRKGVADAGFIVGRTAEGKRFLGRTDPADSDTPKAMLDEDPIGKSIYVTSVGPGSRFTFDKAQTLALIPPRPQTLDADYEYCKLERKGHILEVTINRPDSRNCLNIEANYELDGVFDLFEKDSDLWVAIITGAGDKAFCAGMDLKAAAGAVWIPEGGFCGLTHRKHRLKPIIAAVNGIAMGGGMETVLACDLAIASEEASFALSEVKRGVIAGAGGIQRIVRDIPRKQAMHILLTGDNISAEKAQEYGFINQVVPASEVMSVARKLADKLCAVSPTSISCTMQVLDEVAGITDVVDAVRLPAKALDRLMTSEDMIEGLMAFAEKRPPQWKGR